MGSAWENGGGVDSAAPGRTTPGIDTPGGYAEYMRTTERAAVPVPDFADLAALATLTDAGLAAYRACVKAAPRLSPGTRAVVVGAGGLGHLAIQILKATTSAAVIAVDVRPEARKLAAEVGADIACSPRELASLRLDDAAVVIDFVGSHASAGMAISALGFAGHYLVVGVEGDLTMSTLDLVAGEIKVEGVYVGTYPELVEVTELALSGELQPVVATYPLDRAEDALRDLAAGLVAGRAVLVP